MARLRFPLASQVAFLAYPEVADQGPSQAPTVHFHQMLVPEASQVEELAVQARSHWQPVALERYHLEGMSDRAASQREELQAAQEQSRQGGQEPDQESAAQLRSRLVGVADQVSDQTKAWLLAAVQMALATSQTEALLLLLAFHSGRWHSVPMVPQPEVPQVVSEKKA